MNLEKYNILKDKFIYSYQDKILNLRSIYEKKSSNISLEEFNRLNNLYREYIKEMIIQLDAIFKSIYSVDFCIALSGSLARHSNNIFSDIDINYLTTSNNYEITIEIEDKINYILQEVLKFRGKDKIHSMVVYLPLIDDKRISSIDNNEFLLNFTDGSVIVKCRDNAEQLMYETYNSTRSIYDVIDYFNNHDNEFIIKEWTYCFDFVSNKDYLELYKKYRLEYRKDNNMNIFINNLINNINRDSTYLDVSTEYIENARLKSIYKTTILFNFYELLAIFYRLDKNIDEFNLDSFYNKSTILSNELFDAFNEYLKTIQDLQLLLDKEGVDLSSHSNEILNINNINKYYRILTCRENILKDLNEKKKNLYNKCIISLRRNYK